VEKCVGHSLKIWAPLRTFFASPSVPSWLWICSIYQDLFTGSHLLITQKPASECTAHWAVYLDNCTAVWILCTTWCSV